MSRKPALLLALLLLAAFSQTGCIFLPVCDPLSESYDSNECDETLIGLFLGALTKVAYGEREPPPGSLPCPSSIPCIPPYCKFVQENGDFDSFDPIVLFGDRRTAHSWFGDKTKVVNAVELVPIYGREGVCHGAFVLEFIATTPDGPSTSPSAQVAQVINLRDHVPETELMDLRRVRASAAFFYNSELNNSDNRFGLHLATYAGDPTAFPSEGDPGSFPSSSSGYALLDSTKNFFLIDDGDTWEGLHTEMMLPEDTDFIVVFLEAYENIQNDTTGDEFDARWVDFVMVAIDAGNRGPFAATDRVTTSSSAAVRIVVLGNDSDADGGLDRSTVTITSGPDNGTAFVDGNGVITYTSNPDFVGIDILRYTVADDRGAVSNEAIVFITVFGNIPPIARADTAYTPIDTPVTIDVLANDEDPDGALDPATVTVTLAGSNLVVPNADGTITYTPNTGQTGADTFLYTVADNQGAVSNEATVEVFSTTSVVFADSFETDPQDRWQLNVRGGSSGPNGIAQSVRYDASAGNPGGFRAMTHTIDGQGNISVAHIYTGQYYLPAQQGPIASLNYSEDRLALNGWAVGSRVAVWQGRQVHTAPLPTFSGAAWSTEVALGLRAEDFTPVPDFSASGDTLWFGYERANSNTNPNAVQMREHGIDNWSAEVFSGAPGVVPRRTMDAGRRDR